MATQPCKCGFHNDPTHDCGCSPAQIQQYIARISGPLIDRVDIHIDVPAVKYRELIANDPSENSATIRERVAAARKVQQQRYARLSGSARIDPSRSSFLLCSTLLLP